MPKIVYPLSAAIVRRIRTPGLHAVGAVAGLHLQVTDAGTRSWILRATVSGRRRDIGLGSYAVVGLMEARQKALEARKQIAAGKDPLSEREALRRQLAQTRAAPTFDACVETFMAKKTLEFKNAKHAAQWASTLKAYASPVIGRMPIDEVQLAHVLQVLEPIWQTKTETAMRVRQRIETVSDWATVAGYRKGDNPARWKGNLDHLLPKPRKIAKIEHHAAMPFAQLPTFMAALRSRDGIAPRMVEFAILTAARSGEVRGARWNEFDLTVATWTIPAGRMKAGKEHRIPLSPSALSLLKTLPRKDGDADALVFATTNGTPFSDMALTAVLRRMEVKDATIHGMRSSFRDWAGETTSFPREVIEHALAHQLKDKAEAAYARGTLFDKRRKLMDAWARYLDHAEVVVPIHEAKRA